MPSDLSGGSLDLVGVLEDHQGLGRDVLGQVLSLFASKVLLEQVDFVVLEDALCSSLAHRLGSNCKSQSRLSVHLLLVFGEISSLCWVKLLWPTSFSVLHTSMTSWNPFSVHL